MYNRYVFGPDGSCTKNRMPDSEPHKKEAPEPRCSPAPCPAQGRYRNQNLNQNQNPLDFLRQLLPQGFDTGDLIVVLLLLLMAGDSKEDHDNAMLTLALYFIL